MMTKSDLLTVIDAYLRAVPSVPEKTLSHRVFRDSKTIGSLRGDADITLGRCHRALAWLAANWPADTPLPEALRPHAQAAGGHGDRAA